jgi:uroporphyrin-III C-methyltransferase
VNETPSGATPPDPTATPAAPADSAPEAAVDTPTEPGPAADAAATRTGRSWPWLLLLLLAGIAGWYGYRHWAPAGGPDGALPAIAEPVRPGWQPALDAAAAERSDMVSQLTQLQERQRALEQRIADLAGSNRILREELLGFGERAAMLEQALSRQAQARREGAQALRLDELEFLLQMAAERLQLFGDVEAARRAMQLAEDSLTHLREPLFAGLRQTLAQEIALLDSLPPDPRQRLRAELLRLHHQLPHLPPRAFTDPPPVEQEPSRLRELLGHLITVRRLDSAGIALTPIERASRFGALQLQLGLAQMALETADRDAWQTALEQAAALFDGLFAPTAEVTVEAADRLQALQARSPVRELPRLGAALTELRNLRETRQLGRPATPTVDAQRAPPVEPVDEAPASIDLERE